MRAHCVVLCLVLSACASETGATVAPVDEGEWTFVVLPDTQIYARAYPEIFAAQGRWILEQRERLNIRAVLHVGDIVDDNSEAQWSVARQSLEPLLGEVPLLLVPGNHDYGDQGSANDRQTRLHYVFPLDEARAQPDFGDSMDAERRDSSYHVVDTPEGPWLLLGLEFAPRQSTVEWAGGVLDAHRGMPAALVTHAYLYFDDTRYDWSTRGAEQMWSPHSYGVAMAEPVYDGQALFDALVDPRDDIELVLCGHVLDDGTARSSAEQRNGGTVHELLANYQMNRLGGEGFLRILRFSADGRTIQVQTYSPFLAAFKTDAANEFSLRRQ